MIDIESLMKELNRGYIDVPLKTGFVQKQMIRYSNEYIDVMEYSSSNSPVDDMGNYSKQWNIIIDIKRNFSSLAGYRELSRHLQLRINGVNSGRYRGFSAIRIYGMSENPDAVIIRRILDFIFGQ